MIKAMKSLIKLFSFVVAAALCAGCAMEMDAYMQPGVYISGPYIQNYYDGELSLSVDRDPSGGLPIISLGVNLNGNDPVTVYGKGGSDMRKYEELCRKHSDTSFDGEDHYYDNPAKRCFAHDLATIELVSDSDFDKGHPAGTSLLDMMNYSASSLTRWIKKGYPMGSFMEDCFIIDKKADTLEPEDLSLLCYFNMFQLQFISVPSLSKSHNFTLTVKYDDGTSKALSVKVNF